jgi:tryptophan 2,3-dioxygenase
MSQKYGDGCPFSSESAADGNLTYNDYLKVPELLNLQTPQSEPAHHDELLFIIIHQSYELWFKLILHELENAISYMAKDKVLRAHHFVNRVVQIQKLLVSQIHILETMSPVEFLEFRDRLMPASGFQSTQFREVEFIAGIKDERYLSFFKDRPELMKKLRKRFDGKDLRLAYYEMLNRLGFSFPKEATDLQKENESLELQEKVIHAIKPIYEEPDSNPHLPLFLLSESLLEFDQYLGLWREHHVRVVERVIGFKKGSGGSSGVGYLKSTTSKKAFPALWLLRTYLEKRSD